MGYEPLTKTDFRINTEFLLWKKILTKKQFGGEKILFHVAVLFMSKSRKELQSAINMSIAKNGVNECI